MCTPVSSSSTSPSSLSYYYAVRDSLAASAIYAHARCMHAQKQAYRERRARPSREPTALPLAFALQLKRVECSARGKGCAPRRPHRKMGELASLSSPTPRLLRRSRRALTVICSPFFLFFFFFFFTVDRSGSRSLGGESERVGAFSTRKKSRTDIFHGAPDFSRGGETERAPAY